MEEQRFSDLGRAAAIDRLYEESSLLYKDPLLRSGDSIHFETGNAHVTAASRIFLEGINFDLVYFPLKHLGYKCVIAVTGELYASLARPRLLSVRLGLSSKLDFAEVQEIWQGMVAAAAEHRYSSVSLDLTPSVNGLTIGLSATGETPKPTIDKQLAPGTKDLLCISGSLGAAYLGLKLLEKGKRTFNEDGRQPNLEKYRMILGDYLKPELDANILDHLEDSGIVPVKGYLVTRGLADTVRHLVKDTRFGAKVYADKIPFEGNSFDLGKELDVDPVSSAMNGGDDNRLLFVIRLSDYEKFRHDFQSFEIIGHLALPDVGAVLVTPDGAELPIKAPGWNNNQH